MPIDHACSLSLEVRKIVFSTRGNDKKILRLSYHLQRKSPLFAYLCLFLKLEIWNKDGLLSKKQIQMDGIKNSLKVSKSKLN